ncbi:hypothetical protein AGMMS49992_23550 [Clostridia bacterium]|nr:hypothetical protein AGMMS49992_23550 [Clostridia bacterium]
MDNNCDYKYSIIIPHYNTPFSLIRLLKSIPKRCDVQVIVVDDNSDKEVNVLKKGVNDDARCELYSSKSRKHSAGAARNEGLLHSRGKWILFADADDYFSEGFLNVLDMYYHEEVDIVFFAYLVIINNTNESGKRSLRPRKYLEDFYYRRDHESEVRLRYKWTMPWAKMLKRDLIMDNSIMFDEILVSNDVMFSVRTSNLAVTIEASLTPIYTVTENTTSLTKNKSEIAFDTRLDVIVSYTKYLRDILTREDFHKCISRNRVPIIIQAVYYFGALKGIRTLSKLIKSKVPLYTTR